MIRVAVVDDHAIVRTGLAQLIGTAPDLELVGSYPDGDTAVRGVVEDRPDVVLMDLSMPGVDGVEATRRISANTSEIRIVVLTSLADDNHIVDALDAGAIGYVLKHAHPDDLLSAIRSAAAGDSPLDPKAARVLLDSRRIRRDSDVDLSDRELEVLRHVAQGKTNKVIARELGITERTVKAHLTSVFNQIGVSDRTQAALWATKHLPSH